MAQGIVFGDKKSNKTYGPGDQVSLLKTNVKAAALINTGYEFANGSNVYILGTDQNYVYIKNGTSLIIYNKATKSTVTCGSAMGTYISGAVGVASNNDGFVYLYGGTQTAIWKVNCSTGALVWNHTLAYTVGTLYLIKYYQGYVYAVYSNGSVIELEKIDPSTGALVGTVNGILAQNPTMGIIYNQYFYCFYSGSVYQFDITTGAQTNVWNGLATNISAIDFINKLYFSISASTTTAFNYSKVQQWVYTQSFTYQPLPFINMKTGYFLNDYNAGQNVKINLDGSFSYKQQNPYPIAFNSNGNYTWYNYDLDEFWAMLVYSIGSNTYFALHQIMENITLS